jgi:putative cardiolipin synthase
MKNAMLVFCLASSKWSFSVIFTLLFLAGCASLPPNSGNLESYALQDTADTTLGKTYHKLKEGHPGESGFLLLGNSLDAFTARAELAERAEKSIDAQYYLFHNDLTGILFADLLIQAADRGVRVRLLLDDMDLGERDVGLSTLATHPNIAVRVFNPFSRDTFRTPQFITRFGSVTRRMHNKSFTVDNVSTIVGGRNIGDEYFGADPVFAFADLDLLAIGPVVPQVSTSFDAYWNSEFSYPIDVLRPDLVDSSDFEEGRKRLAAYLAQDFVEEYKQSLFNAKLAKDLRDRSVQYIWGEGLAVYDKPQKIESDDEGGANTLSYQVRRFIKGLNKELIIFTPYFVPGKEGTKKLCEHSKRGVRVRILTNSLASTDVSVVHAGYAKYRKALLRCGVELYELDKTTNKQTKKRKGAGSSTASLHAKSFVLDREHVFIGSLNLDPLSIVENTEVGIMLSSTEIANSMADIFSQMVERMAFRLELRRDNEGYEFIYWHGQEEGEKRVWTSDPHTGFWQRFGVFLMGLLPIESKL